MSFDWSTARQLRLHLRRRPDSRQPERHRLRRRRRLDSDSVAVSVNNVAPSIAISGVASVDEGSPYSLTLGAVSDPGADTVTSYVVHWGDGNTAPTPPTAPRATPTPTARRPRDHRRPGRRGRHLPRPRERALGHVNNVAPSTPNLVSPADNSTTGDNTPAFDWSDSTDPAGANDTITYRIQVDNNCDFSSPERDQTTSLVRLHARRCTCGRHVLLACECERRGRRHERLQLGPAPHDRHQRAERAVDQPRQRQPDQRARASTGRSRSARASPASTRATSHSSRAAASPAPRSPA